VPETGPGPRVRLRARDVPGVGHLLITAHDVGLRIGLGVGGSASPPRPDELRIVEVLYDVRADANCDGTIDAGDQFVEIANVTTEARSLDGVVVAGAAGTFARIPDETVLGPGEVLVLFGSAPGAVTSAGPWCAELGADATALTPILSGVEQPLDMAMDMPVLRGAAGELLFTALDGFPVSPGASCYVIDGHPTPHLDAGGAADRTFSPGTREDGRPFVDLELAP
jgi:hypothetical protein